MVPLDAGAVGMSPTDHNSSTTALRLDNLEREMPTKVPITEYNLQIKGLEATNIRLEDMLTKLVIQMNMLQDRLINQEIKAEQRAASHQQALSDLQTEQLQTLSQFQNRIIGVFVSLFVVVVGGWLTWFFTHPH
jgi:predicted nuclease with TOPRIM domain